MGKKQQMKIKAREAREEEQAKKVLRNVIIGLVVIAAGIVVVSMLL